MHEETGLKTYEKAQTNIVHVTEEWGFYVDVFNSSHLSVPNSPMPLSLPKAYIS